VLIETLGALGPVTGLLQSRQKHRSKNGNDCNNNKKFDQREFIVV
jgi:hypothetical protein